MTFRPAILVALLAPCLAGTASAATVTLDLRGPDGRAIADGVVTIDVPGHAPAVARGSYVMEQKAIAFQPHVLVVPVGASVSFPNRDMVRHHVYSFSKAKRFDLKLYGREDQRSVVFDRPGVVALGCNIHDTMSGFIIVSSSPFTGKGDANGHVVIPDVPPGPVRLALWAPSMRQPGAMIAQAMVVPVGGVAKTIVIGR